MGAALYSIKKKYADLILSGLKPLNFGNAALVRDSRRLLSMNRGVVAELVGEASSTMC